MKVASRAIVPTPFEIAILLTLFVLLLATLFTNSSVTENLSFWGQGFWSLLTFMTQMCLILLGGFVVATSRPVGRCLQSLAKIPQSALQVYLCTFGVSAVACWINWGLGLVVGAFFAKEVARQNPQAHFPLLVATSYMGFIFWHGGLSGSIPLTVGTAGNFSEKWLGDLIHFDQTVFSFFNLSLVACLLVSLSLLIIVLSRRVNRQGSVVAFQGDEEIAQEDGGIDESSIFSRPSFFVIVALMIFFLVLQISQGDFGFSLNQINFLLIVFGLILHGSLQAYMEAVQRGCRRLAPILVQYPLYAGIMGIMVQSGLAINISDAFVAVSSEATFPVYMFLSAGLVNLFVPSGGGQWAVQAPVVIEGAQQLGVPFWKVILAVSWGDAWTNLAQPFWALPLLSIVGLGIRDILPYCLQALLLSGIVISGFFLLA